MNKLFLLRIQKHLILCLTKPPVTDRPLTLRPPVDRLQLALGNSFAINRHGPIVNDCPRVPALAAGPYEDTADSDNTSGVSCEVRSNVIRGIITSTFEYLRLFCKRCLPVRRSRYKAKLPAAPATTGNDDDDDVPFVKH